MSTANITTRPATETFATGKFTDSNSSGVSWAAVSAGAFVTAALSLLLLSLGAGLGLSSISPWASAGATASRVGASAILWLIINEIISSAMGGYLAGRLRTKWASIHTDEVYFRDTAHGFLVWCTSVVITVSLMAAASAAMVGVENPGTSQSASPASSGIVGSNRYFVDALFRSNTVSKGTDDAGVRAEAGRIVEYAIGKQDMSQADKTYLAQLVANQAGLSQVDAQNRVSSVLADARQALDKTRKATAHLLLWIFLALLTGAFSASLAATIGGRQRDHVVTI